QAYIVYMGSLPRGEYLASAHHVSLLQEVIDASSVEDSLIRSYKRSFNGFAAKITDTEAKKLASMKGVISVFPSRTLQLLTTRSWEFMGFNDTIKTNPAVESDVIVGVIDSGIWPETPSFNDDGLGPAPKKWKGACRGGKNFTCNNKIIGARFYSSLDEARDRDGHGTHTSSTAAGNKVKNASFFGLANGTARGGVPSSRIAAYRVCSSIGCSSESILAAFDDAIADQVDVITISIGPTYATNFFEDPIAIGSFHAMTKGILTSNSAGNSGPGVGTVSSVAPWMLSVAASTTDRLFFDTVVLGNGKTLVGKSINSFNLNGKKVPIVYGEDASNKKCSKDYNGQCLEGCMDSDKVKGKILLCDVYDDSSAPSLAGSLGAIVYSNINVSFVVPLPQLALDAANYNVVKSYYTTSAKEAEATILKSETFKDSNAPVVADFSSRGPNPITPDILKPDVSAPGVEILAAYCPLASPSSDWSDTRHVNYSILSGTSMACPHAAGVAAYIKSVHPHWSPAAIKSAIMTTARPMSSTRNPQAEFAYGSGHINPVEAINPGLVYEASNADYISMLCGLGYNVSQIRQISGDNSSCQGENKTSPKDLNYPAMTALVSPSKSFKITFRRKVTNVGIATSTYKPKVFSSSPKFNITVVPGSLSFKSLNDSKSFNVTVVGGGLPNNEAMLSAALVWYDGTHSVRSPIVVHTFDKDYV
ncbi:Peptidase_S8 domain-containing protein/Inhibitor_I9 domain-containing protein, partial [Cephalotus follicularis]